MRTKFLIARHKLAESTTHNAEPRHGLIQGLTWHHHGSSKHMLNFGQSGDRRPHGAAHGAHPFGHHSYGMGFATDALNFGWSPRSPRSNAPSIWSQHGHGHGNGHPDHGGGQGAGSRGDVESAERSATKPSEDDIVERLSKALMLVSLGLRQLHFINNLVAEPQQHTTVYTTNTSPRSCTLRRQRKKRSRWMM